MAKGIIIETGITVYSEWVDDAPDQVRIELPRAFIQRILKLSRAVKELGIDKTVEYDCTPEFLYEDKEEDEVDIPMRSELTSLNVGEQDFYWSGIVKHSEPAINWETDVISIRLLRELERVWRTPKSRLPLLLGSLETAEANSELNVRLKSL